MIVKPFTCGLFAEAEGFACNSLKQCDLGMSGMEVLACIVVWSSCQSFF